MYDKTLSVLMVVEVKKAKSQTKALLKNVEFGKKDVCYRKYSTVEEMFAEFGNNDNKSLNLLDMIY